MNASETVKINIAEQATQLAEPFTMVDLAQIDDLALSVFLCQGTLPFHRHLDQDELFLPYSGAIHLETDWGNLHLRPGDAAVVPKGVGHRSSSLQRSLVLLLQPRLMITRRNGHRRLYAREDEQGLPRVSVPAVGHDLEADFEPVPLIDVDTFALTLTVCQGMGPWRQVDSCDHGWKWIGSQRLPQRMLLLAKATPCRRYIRLSVASPLLTPQYLSVASRAQARNWWPGPYISTASGRKNPFS